MHHNNKAFVRSVRPNMNAVLNETVLVGLPTMEIDRIKDGFLIVGFPVFKYLLALLWQIRSTRLLLQSF